MDRDHRLDAPDNEALRGIEQLGDHSELSTIYPHGHSAWEGTDIMSAKDREDKRTQEQVRVSLAIRKQFALIGLLTPLPAILVIMLIVLAATFIDLKNIINLIVPVFLSVGIVTLISIWSTRYLYGIFYSHAVKATPFLAVLIGLITLSVDALFLVTQPLHSGWLPHDALIISAAVLIVSVVLSGILVLIWASPKLRSGAKLGCIGLTVIGIFFSTAALYLL